MIEEKNLLHIAKNSHSDEDPFALLKSYSEKNKIQKRRKSVYQGRAYKLGVKRYLEYLIDPKIIENPTKLIEVHRNKFLKKTPVIKKKDSTPAHYDVYRPCNLLERKEITQVECILRPNMHTPQDFSESQAYSFISGVYSSLESAMTHLQEGQFEDGELIKRLEMCLLLFQQGISTPYNECIYKVYHQFEHTLSLGHCSNSRVALLISIAKIFPLQGLQVLSETYLSDLYRKLLVLINQHVSEDKFRILFSGLEFVSVQSDSLYTEERQKAINILKDIYQETIYLRQVAMIETKDALLRTITRISKQNNELVCNELVCIESQRTLLQCNEVATELFSLMLHTEDWRSIRSEKINSTLNAFALLQKNSVNQPHSEEILFIRNIYSRYQQIIDSHLFYKQEALQIARIIEMYAWSSLASESSYLNQIFQKKLSIDLVSRQHTTYKIDRKVHKLPYSLLFNSISDEVTILLKRKYSCFLVAQGGFKKIKEALFLPKNPNNPAIEAVEAITTDMSTGLQEVKYAQTFGSSPGHVQCFMIRQYRKKETVDTEQISIISERYDGPLDRKKRYSLPLLASLAQQVYLGIYELHAKNILHADIKPENILQKTDSTNIEVALTDYGLSHYPYESKNYRGYGTPFYADPSSIKQSYRSISSQHKSSDIWAAALSILEVSLFITPQIESVRKTFIDRIFNDGLFTQWSTALYNHRHITFDIARAAAKSRKMICQQFAKDISILRYPYTTITGKNEYAFIKLLSRILVSEESQYQSAAKIQEECMTLVTASRNE